MSSPVRAQSFGEFSEHYARFRPGPPREVLDYLLPEGASAAVDVGAGTGNLTRLLLERVAEVSAIEPDARMRSVLADGAPGAQVLAGKAEQMPLADGSQDAVVSSSAWHWVDPERAVPEAARVLRSGGRLGAVWSSLDREVEWVSELWRSMRPSSDWPRAASRERHGLRLPAGAAFGEVEGPHDIRYSLSFTAEDLLGLSGTYSAVIVQPPPQREEFLRGVGERLFADPRLADGAALAVPMRAHCWRATRR